MIVKKYLEIYLLRLQEAIRATWKIADIVISEKVFDHAEATLKFLKLNTQSQQREAVVQGQSLSLYRLRYISPHFALPDDSVNCYFQSFRRIFVFF
jgi:hypothetical protein